MMKPITIYKGNDSDAFDGQTICIKLKTDMSLLGATARFSLMSFSKVFTADETASKEFTVSLDASTTAAFPLGLVFGKLTLFDKDERVMTVACNIPFDVKLARGLITPGFVSLTTSNAEVTVELGVDYSLVYNKPKINGVEVYGDRTGRAYELNKILDYSEETVYNIGDQVVHGSRLFSCIAKIAEPEEWNAAHWTELGASELAKSAVHYIEDAGKTEEEKGQARKNIGAASQSALDAVATRLSTAEGTITSQGERLSTAEGTITSQGERLSTAEETITSQGERLSTAEETITSQGERLSTAEETITSQGERLSTAEENITALQGRLQVKKDDVGYYIDSADDAPVGGETEEGTEA